MTYITQEVICLSAIAEFVNRHSGAYPLLEKALVNEEKAHSVKVEWLVDDDPPVTPDGNLRYKAEYNYTEIFRAESRGGVCSQIEASLRRNDGPRLDLSSSNPVSHLGGIRYYTDSPEPFLSLRVLRDLTHYVDEIRPSRNEYIAEVTVLVRWPTSTGLLSQ